MNLDELANRAWLARDNAYVIGKTKVGAALCTSSGEVFTGCNVEHRYRVGDVHAEVNAITNMVNAGFSSFDRIVIVAERDRFTPCGSCLDWIFQFAGPECVIAYQTSRKSEIIRHTAHELMPYYPY